MILLCYLNPCTSIYLVYQIYSPITKLRNILLLWNFVLRPFPVLLPWKKKQINYKLLIPASLRKVACCFNSQKCYSMPVSHNECYIESPELPSAQRPPNTSISQYDQYTHIRQNTILTNNHKFLLLHLFCSYFPFTSRIDSVRLPGVSGSYASMCYVV